MHKVKLIDLQCQHNNFKNTVVLSWTLDCKIEDENVQQV